MEITKITNCIFSKHYRIGQSERWDGGHISVNGAPIWAAYTTINFEDPKNRPLNTMFLKCELNNMATASLLLLAQLGNSTLYPEFHLHSNQHGDTQRETIMRQSKAH